MSRCHITDLLKIDPFASSRKALDVPDLSFVIPAKDEASNIAETVRKIEESASVLIARYEIIVIDDGSKDQTFAVVKALTRDHPVHGLRLSRNFGKEHAIMAGLCKAKGDAVVILDADLQEPLHHLPQMLEHYKQGYEMVYAVRANRRDETSLKRICTHIFYSLLNHNESFKIPKDARDFRLMDRRVVEALCALPERNLFMKGLYGWVGFRSIAVPIELAERKNGKSSFGFRNLLRLGFTGITAFTTWPLRVWTVIGSLFAICSMLYGLWILLRTIIWGADLAGWTTLAVAVFFLGGIQLISIGVLGEYLSRVFTEVKGRPGYLIAEEIGPEIEQ